MTVRPISQSTKDGNAEDGVRPHHRREPNTNALPSTTTAAPETPSAVISEHGADSYFTAHMPSTSTPQDSNPTAQTVPAATVTQLIDTAPSLKPIPKTSPAAGRPQTPPTQPPRWPVTSTSFELQPRVHRFSLMKGGSWSPLEMILGSALGTGTKCDLCFKRLGWKPCLECDDCSLTWGFDITFSDIRLANIFFDSTSVHMKCGETAPMDCEVREAQKITKQSRIPLCMIPKRSPPKSKSPKQHK